MLRDEPTLRPGLFRLPDQPVASTILIPGFRAAKRVRGAFGWFTAGWIEKLAPGLADHLNRQDADAMEFTVAPVFFPDELAAVKRGIRMGEADAAERIVDVFVGGRVQASALGRHALDCLSWMVAASKLRLRVAVPTRESNYHPKIWLFDDGEDQVIARGSGNATLKGVSGGVEHLDVDVSWLPQSCDRVEDGMRMVNDWSKGSSFGLRGVYELPAALTKRIIQTAPARPPQPEDYDRAVRETIPPSYSFGRPERKLRIPSELQWQSGKYAHQGEAVNCWERTGSPERGVITMATGAGKTLTALICAARVQDRLCDAPLLIVISAPSVPLIAQWQKEVRRFQIMPVVPSLEKSVEKSLTRLFGALRGGGAHILIVTNKLLCTPEFQKTVEEKLGFFRKPVTTMFIADEAHTLGAESFIHNKPNFFEKRLALSATPSRQYDPDGTEEIFSYFGETVYEFGIDRAIGFCLSQYNYYVHSCTLNEEEIEKFLALSKRIASLSNRDDADAKENLRSLLISRRRIVETASTKVSLLRAVLERRGPRELCHALVYASAKNPSQFEQIAEILTELDVKWAPVTQETTADANLLHRTLESFSRGELQVLLAKKVLDEGVDIPSIREAFIVASSTVEREWIQRRGRVLRIHPEKPWAIIHDFVCMPPADVFQRINTPSLKKIVANELHRAYSFGTYARNVSGADNVLEDLDRISNIFWPENSGMTVKFGQQHFIASATPRGVPW